MLGQLIKTSTASFHVEDYTKLRKPRSNNEKSTDLLNLLMKMSKGCSVIVVMSGKVVCKWFEVVRLGIRYNVNV